VAPKANIHLGGEDAERYSLGEMPEEELARSEEHLLICDACRRLVTDSDAYVAAMRKAAAKLRRKSKKEGGR
jgi:anti-sigma factor RsiW